SFDTRGVCIYCIIFFFQAEDGIRDFHVTGVQTCALPIFINSAYLREAQLKAEKEIENAGMVVLLDAGMEKGIHPVKKRVAGERRSEERRVGKECRCRRTAERKKKRNTEREAEWKCEKQKS